MRSGTVGDSVLSASALGMISVGVDGLVWGAAAALLLLALLGDVFWLSGALIAAVVFVAWDQLMFAQAVASVGFLPSGFSLAEQAPGIAVGAAATLLGFGAGRLLISRLLSRSRSLPVAP